MRLYLLLALFPLFIGCGKKTPANNYVSATSLIEQQVKHLDTSLYSIKRFSSLDTLAPDTASIAREYFRKEVSDFLNIPDLSDPDLAENFKEETRFDEMLNRAIISYTPIEPGKEPFQRIELFVEPNMATGDQVKTILATRRQNDRNGFEQMELVWQMDKSCTRILTTRKPGATEETRTTKWSWN